MEGRVRTVGAEGRAAEAGGGEPRAILRVWAMHARPSASHPSANAGRWPGVLARARNASSDAWVALAAGDRGQPGSGERGEQLGRRRRPPGVDALDERDAVAAQGLEDLLVLDALGDDGDLQAGGGADDRGDDLVVGG